MSPASATRPRWRLSLLLMAISGFAGLGYQIVWTQQSALWLGHETAAVLAVVAAFFGGIAVGASLSGSRIEHGARPERWYVGCELAIAAWGLVLVFLMAPASDWLVAFGGVLPTPGWQWTLAFVGTFVLLLPATAAMGASLPAIERVVAPADAAGRTISAHYASNTVGAVLGVLATAFWLIPTHGLKATAGLCVILNLACALLAAWSFRGRPRHRPTTMVPARRAAHRFSGLDVRLAATGLLGIGYEVVVVLVLSQVTEDTVYTFALLLVVYLAFTALGAAAYRRWLTGDPRRGLPADPDATDLVTDRLCVALAIACLIGLAGLWMAPGVRDTVVAILGPSMGAAVGAEAILALVAFALPTLVMGALFSRLSDTAGARGLGYGRALAINVAGAAVAPLVFAVLLVPTIGLKGALLVVAAGYLALVDRRAWARPQVWLPAAIVILVAVLAPVLAFVDVPDGGHIAFYRQGVAAAVSVVEDDGGVRRLRIDDRQQEGTSATARVDGRQALLPLLLHPKPRHVLFLGLGTGVTASTALDDPAVDIDAVELLPDVVAASALFARPGAVDPRLHLRVADARRYARTTDRRYDVIVADNYQPARSGSGALYTVEHFRTVRDRLAPDGVFCQWLPLHQLDLESLRSIVRSFTAVYPGGWAMLASNSLETPILGLIGRRGRLADTSPVLLFDVAAVKARFADPMLARSAADHGIDDAMTVLGSFVAGPRTLVDFAAGAPANTDDRPVVAYLAPRITYAPTSTPADRLETLLTHWTISPSELIRNSDEAGFDARLAAYWKARDRFIAVGIGVQPSSDVRTMLAQVRVPLLDVLRISPDFRPAYDPLLRMAQASASSDPETAAALLTELDRLQPSRLDAREALDGLNHGLH